MNISKLSDQLSEPSIRRKLLQFLILSYITPSTSSSTNKFSMMPLAPTMSELPTAHKPKIGFSIDSIVGDGEGKEHRSQRPSSVDKSPHCPTHLNPTSPEKSKTASMRDREASSEMASPLAYLQKHNHFLHHHLLQSENSIKKESMSPPMPMLLPNHHPLHQLRLPLMHHHLSPPPPGSNRSSTNYSPGRVSPANSNNDNVNDSINSRGKEQDRATECSNTSSRSPSPQASESPRPNSDIPSSPHEIHRPLVSASHGSPRPGMPGGGHPSQMPVGPHGLPQFGGYPPGMLNFAAMAAAAAAHSHHHPGPHPGIPGWLPQSHPVAPHHHHPAAAAHPLYPWLLAKHSRLFPPRFGPGPDLPGFLFQPFRKPKRIRTAFSPSQLLKLEHAFEKNHYVVGAERKQLAKSLSLSETQVKVWFQNRRTKHKRVETEDDSPMSMKRCDGSKGNGSSGSDHPSSGSGLSTSADSSTRNYSEEMSDEDEEIVMDEDYSEEEEMEHGHHNNLHHHLHKSFS